MNLVNRDQIHNEVALDTYPEVVVEIHFVLLPLNVFVAREVILLVTILFWL